MTLRVHHLNCMSARMPGARHPLVAHCVLAEAADGLVLADTGLGLGDVHDPEMRLSKFFLGLLKPQLRADMTAARQIERLGYRTSDVRDIILTHLDFDQAGGLDDFPRARVHVTTRERDHAFAQRTWLDRQRFRPQQWSTRNRWIAYDTHEIGGDWMGLASVRAFAGLPPDFLLVPLPGHSRGHAGVAIHGDRGWLLLAGDAFFDPGELQPQRHCSAGLRLFQRLMDVDRPARLASQQALRKFQNEHPEVTVFCTHDPVAFEHLSGRAAHQPPEARRSPGDPYVEKIVRRPIDMPLAPRTAAPGLEVIDYDDDINIDLDSVAPPRSSDGVRSNR